MNSFQKELAKTPQILQLAQRENTEPCLVKAPLVVFCGCGTSCYLGAQAAKLCTAHGRPAAAMEAVELLEEMPAYPQGTVFVFISRSGTSMETVLAQQAVKAAGWTSFYLGCTVDSILHRACDGARVLAYANESMILESFSYFAQFLAAVQCCGIQTCSMLPQLLRQMQDQARQVYREHIKAVQINRLICLGAPFYMPLLREMTLKNGEITQLFSELWGILEFRHGPRTWADEHCLITVVSGQATQRWDAKVAEELVDYGCKVLWYGETPVAGTTPINVQVPRHSPEEILLLGIFLVELASCIGAAEGVEPDQLRNIEYHVGTL